tara:strand:- start:27 stop:479 length:453 start_codon:yes stop_codon:yes gene_type:complete
MRKPILALALVMACFLVSCGDRFSNRHALYRPKFIREGTKIPFLDEHNLQDVQLVEIDNPFPQADRKRIYSLWFYLDGRGRFALHAESGENRGQTIYMFINGQQYGYHPITKPISDGILPIVLDVQFEESGARVLHEQIKGAILEVQKRR